MLCHTVIKSDTVKTLPPPTNGLVLSLLLKSFVAKLLKLQTDTVLLVNGWVEEALISFVCVRECVHACACVLACVCAYIHMCMCVHIESNICLQPSLSVVHICSVSLNETACMHVGTVCVFTPPCFISSVLRMWAACSLSLQFFFVCLLLIASQLVSLNMFSLNRQASF